MGLLYHSDFGADTTGVPPPNTTARWNQTNVTYSVESVAGFAGGKVFRIVTGADNRHRLRSFDAANGTLNVRLRTRFRFTASSSFDGAWALLMLRGAGTSGGPEGGDGDGYQAIIANVSGVWHLFLEKNENGAQTVLDDVTLSAPTLGDIWNYRFEVEDVSGDAQLRAWVWDDGDPEPASPTASAVDADPLPAGWHAVGHRRANSTIDYDFVTIHELVAVPSGQNIVGATFSFATHRRLAPGSDNWPLTWADDGHQYTAWGDGGGFGGTNTTGRVSMGIARLEGSDPATMVGVNINGGVSPESGNSTWPNHSMGDVAGSGKSYGIISIGGVLYMWVSPGSAEGHLRATLWRSNDKGATWTETSVVVQGTEAPATNRIWPTIVQLGQDYALNSDGYIYSAWVGATDPPSGGTFNVQAPGAIYLSRVLIGDLETAAAHEWLTGFDGEVPQWGAVGSSAPMYTLASGVGFHASGITWVSAAARFVMAVDWNPLGSGNTASAAGLKLVQSKNPWGPWTEFYSTDEFGIGTLEQDPGTFGYFLSPKWQSGLDFTLTCCGLAGQTTSDLDSYNTVDGSFTLAPPGPRLALPAALLAFVRD